MIYSYLPIVNGDFPQLAWFNYQKVYYNYELYNLVIVDSQVQYAPAQRFPRLHKAIDIEVDSQPLCAFVHHSVLGTLPADLQHGSNLVWLMVKYSPASASASYNIVYITYILKYIILYKCILRKSILNGILPCMEGWPACCHCPLWKK